MARHRPHNTSRGAKPPRRSRTAESRLAELHARGPRRSERRIISESIKTNQLHQRHLAAEQQKSDPVSKKTTSALTSSSRTQPPSANEGDEGDVPNGIAAAKDVSREVPAGHDLANGTPTGKNGWYAIRGIIMEGDNGRYLVEWEGRNPKTNASWPRSWLSREDVNVSAIKNWEALQTF